VSFWLAGLSSTTRTRNHRSIDLGEGAEEAFPPFGRDPDPGVTDGEREARLVLLYCPKEAG